MEADVVEGADSPLVDGAGPCGSKEAETLFIVLRGMLEEETDKKKNEEKQWSRREWRRSDRREGKRRRKAKKMADRN